MSDEEGNKEVSEAIQDLLDKVPTRWNSDSGSWEQDLGYLAAVHRGDGSHVSRRRQDKNGQWVLRGNAPNGYIPDWAAYERELPKWAQSSDGDVDNRRFIKMWSDADDLDELHKRLHWLSVKELEKKMRALKKWLNDHGLSAPSVLKHPAKMMDRGDVLWLLHNNIVSPVGKDGKAKDGQYQKQSDGSYKFVPNGRS